MGRIKALPKKIERLSKRGKNSSYTAKEKIMTPLGNGSTLHLHVKLFKGGAITKKYIHRAVLEAFVGPAPGGFECAHGDGNPLNNSLSNLRWASRYENIMDKVAHGTHSRGEKSVHSKLSEKDVRKIKELLLTKTPYEISKNYPVSHTSIYDIKKGKTWGHVD
jgi:hypothetical protein